MSSPQTPSTIKFIQAQAFVLSGSGSSIGDVTINLQSFYGIDGNAIVTADLGSFAYGTLEPGNGDQEEAILFTGVTQNANGTATLTGVSSLGFKTPYDLTSGLQKTHAGASKFILSNDAAFYNNLILYMNAIAGAGASNASTTVKGIVQAATISQVNAGTPTGSTGAVLAVTPDALVNTDNALYVTGVRNTGIPYVVASGTPSAYTATLATSIISTLASGTFLNFLVPATNASGATLNVNSLGAKTLKKSVTSSLASGDLPAGQIASVVFTGTDFQVAFPAIRTYASGIASKNLADADATQTIAHEMALPPGKISFSYSFFTGSGPAYLAVGSGVFTPSGQFSIINLASVNNSSQDSSSSSSSTNGIILGSNNISEYSAGTVSVDATNIYIAWVKSGTPTGTVSFLWEAEK